MKKITWISTGILITVMAFLLIAADTTRRPHWYHDWGFTAGDMVGFVIDSSTVVGDQLKRRAINVPLSSGAVVDTVTDSTWTHLLTVPAAKTIVLKTARLATRVEPDMNGAAKSVIFHFLWYDNSGSTLDTVATKFHIDKDSVAFDNAPLAITRLDSNFAAGDILWAMIYNDSTLTVAPEGMGITLEYLLDE